MWPLLGYLNLVLCIEETMTTAETSHAKKYLALGLNFPPLSRNTTYAKVVFHCSGKENDWVTVTE